MQIGMTASQRAFILPDRAGFFAFLQRTRSGLAGLSSPWLYIRGADAHIVIIASSFCRTDQ
jgi:hypothetical protein